METDTVKLSDFITANRISMTVQRIDSNPNMPESREMDHWKCILVRREEYNEMTGRRYAPFSRVLPTAGKIAAKMTVPFSMGFGHQGAEPDRAGVLDCLASDSASIEQSSFEDWAADMGYDADSRKAEKTYKACEHAAARLKRFLGDDLYQVLLYGTERE